MKLPLMVALTGAFVIVLTHGAAAQSGQRKTYIVQLAEPPAVVYDGEVSGYAATRPAEGQKIDPDHPGVVGYKNHLTLRHHAVLDRVGGGNKLYSYAYVFNGFAAQITEAQAQALAKTPGVLSVVPDEIRKLDTATTPAFLGLSGGSGFWRENEAKGEDVIMGMVDTGIWPEHRSFSDRDQRGQQTYERIHGWKGTCVAGEQFTAANCNRKLIGARYYNAGFLNENAVLPPGEFNSPRDANGHGTHTASTAGGNADVPVPGVTAVLGKISGMAPRARIAAYKVCWGGSCFTSDSVAAIDQAVADGVDVINFSISGTRTDFLDPVEQAFMRAAAAGVFVAASAGNSGPTTFTVAHPSPWITTVAAGTHNRNTANATGSTTLGNGAQYTGWSLAAALGSKPLVDSVNVGLPLAIPAEVDLCYPGTLDPTKVAGKIVLCKRGVIALTEKSRAVFEAGGVGMLLYNSPPSATSIVTTIHSVPTVHVVEASGVAIKSYIASAVAGATASIAKATILFDLPAPFTASFSSRGPSQAAGGNLLKPDIIAPGQEILAGVSPVGYGGRLFEFLNGTSMSSPHIAGIAALMKELHPKWSPMAIKSALMTSAGDVLDGPNTMLEVIVSQGAGHVRPNNADDLGLVFDSGPKDWLGFLCGTPADPDVPAVPAVPVATCTAANVPVLHASDLNVPSIAIGSGFPTKQTVTRRVTNKDSRSATYTATYDMPGFTVDVSPPSLTLASGQTKSFTVTFTRTTAPASQYAGGQLTWTGGTSTKASAQRAVRIPMLVAVP